MIPRSWWEILSNPNLPDKNLIGYFVRVKKKKNVYLLPHSCNLKKFRNILQQLFNKYTLLLTNTSRFFACKIFRRHTRRTNITPDCWFWFPTPSLVNISANLFLYSLLNIYHHFQFFSEWLLVVSVNLISSVYI